MNKKKTLFNSIRCSALADPQPEMPILKAPDGLTKDQKKMLSQLPDLSKITNWARQASGKLQIQVDQIHTSSRQMMHFGEHADAHLNRQVEILGKLWLVFAYCK